MSISVSLKPYNLAGFEPQFFRSWGGRDDHCIGFISQDSPLDLSVRSSISSTSSFRGAPLVSTASMENIQKKRPGEPCCHFYNTYFIK
jgi:hypothetical protein